jgi:hypothetical protein
MGTMDVAFFKGGSVAQGEKEEGKGEGVDVGVPRGRGRRKERRGAGVGSTVGLDSQDGSRRHYWRQQRTLTVGAGW